MALILLIVFIYYAIQVTKSINSLIRSESVVTATTATAVSDDEEDNGDEGFGENENHQKFNQINQSRKAAM